MRISRHTNQHDYSTIFLNIQASRHPIDSSKGKITETEREAVINAFKEGALVTARASDMFCITKKMIACNIKKRGMRKTFEIKTSEEERPAWSIPNCISAS